MYVYYPACCLLCFGTSIIHDFTSYPCFVYIPGFASIIRATKISFFSFQSYTHKHNSDSVIQFQYSRECGLRNWPYIGLVRKYGIAITRFCCEVMVYANFICAELILISMYIYLWDSFMFKWFSKKCINGTCEFWTLGYKIFSMPTFIVN